MHLLRELNLMKICCKDRLNGNLSDPAIRSATFNLLQALIFSQIVNQGILDEFGRHREKACDQTGQGIFIL